jgi:hypothetical protein
LRMPSGLTSSSIHSPLFQVYLVLIIGSIWEAKAIS